MTPQHVSHVPPACPTGLVVVVILVVVAVVVVVVVVVVIGVGVVGQQLLDDDTNL